jgi:mannose/fructose-specific phosphotransferase system component IIA
MTQLHGVVVGHAGLSAALVGAVEQIAGQGSGLTAVSNSGCDRDRLEELIMAAVGGQPTVVFIDMPSGSCLFAVMRRLESMPHVRVVTGVNLAMLLEFVFNRDGTPAQAAEHLAQVGVRAIAAL